MDYKMCYEVIQFGGSLGTSLETCKAACGQFARVTRTRTFVQDYVQLYTAHRLPCPGGYLSVTVTPLAV